ncbi:MAG: HAMP domain-containing histidine kinase [Rickettsiaceae bacterium]|nr:HAMP domain-containing histidine kinase [Rickettsiaceae bacterium]
MVYGLWICSTFLKSNQDETEEAKIKASSLENKVITLEKEKDYFRREFQNLSIGIDYLDNYFTNKENQLKKKNLYLHEKIKLMNIEIEKLQDMKDEFLRNMPHECNAPLTGILSLSDALYSSYDSLNKKTIKDSIKNIVNSGDRLKSYIHNMIDLSKLTTLSYELDREQVNLSELVKNRPYLYKKIFSDDKKQEFKFDVEDDIVINVDEYFMTQAIDNLISNAVKYGEGEEITISLKKVGNNIEFKIIDQGIGIPENELHSIFSKFMVSSRTKTPAGGRGIGLALVQKIIEAHKGKVWAKNNEEQGSTFQFVMPIS